MLGTPTNTAPVGARILVADERGNVRIARAGALRWYDEGDRLIERPCWWMALPSPPREVPAVEKPKPRSRK
jgi:hypothetical protein